MAKELYFDIHSEDCGGSLYRIVDEKEGAAFYFNYSVTDPRSGEVKVFETWYISFEAFWKVLTKDPVWYYQHPLFVHPEQRAFIQGQLKGVNWAVYPDKKWQESHQKQWKKVLTDPPEYYNRAGREN
jgi:hypothetical protein